MIDVRYASNDTLITSLLTGSEISIPLPSSEVTVLLKFLKIPVFEKSYNLTLENKTDTITVNNLLKVDTLKGYAVISVEKNGTLKSVDFDCEKGRAMLVTQSEAIFLDMEEAENISGALYAESYEYNPFTGHLLANLNGTRDTGLVLVMCKQGMPLVLSAENVMESISYEPDKEELIIYANPGNVSIYHTEDVFSVTLNDTALVNGTDYTFDELGNLLVNVPNAGFVHVYYANPVSASLEKDGKTIKVYLATPYEFRGKIHYTVDGNAVLEDRTVAFTATPPLTVLEINVERAGEASIEIYDEDSNQLLYTTTVTLLDYTTVLIVFLLLLATITVIIVTARGRKEKAMAEMEKEWRFFRKL